jgi:hypothetical protein
MTTNIKIFYVMRFMKDKVRLEFGVIQHAKVVETKIEQDTKQVKKKQSGTVTERLLVLIITAQTKDVLSERMAYY